MGRLLLALKTFRPADQQSDLTPVLVGVLGHANQDARVIPRSESVSCVEADIPHEYLCGAGREVIAAVVTGYATMWPVIVATRISLPSALQLTTRPPRS